MSRVALTLQSMSVSGLAVTSTTPNGTGTGNGNLYVNDGKTYILVSNATTGTTATVTVPNLQTATVFGVTLPSITVSAPPAKQTIVWVPTQYNNSAGSAAVDIDTSTNITWAAIQMPAQFQ